VIATCKESEAYHSFAYMMSNPFYALPRNAYLSGDSDYTPRRFIICVEWWNYELHKSAKIVIE